MLNFKYHSSHNRSLPFLLCILIFFNSCKKEIHIVPETKTDLKIENISAAKNNTIIVPVNNTIMFSGYKWIVTDSPKKRKSPGNNYWSQNAVWVDGNGYLHLTLSKDPKSNKWYCAQLTSEKKFGSGAYEFWIEGRVDKLDKNVVFGLFNYSGIDYFDEIDIEFARWGNTNNKNLHYTVYPEENTNAEIMGASTEFLLNEPYSKHRITRTTSDIKFESYYGFQDNKFNEKIFTSPTISKKEMPVYINLWSFNGLPPSDAKNVEIIIQKFAFTL